MIMDKYVRLGDVMDCVCLSFCGAVSWMRCKEKLPGCCEWRSILQRLSERPNAVLEWIDVREKLPEKSGKYLVFNESEDVWGQYYNADVEEPSERWGFWNDHFDLETMSVIDSEWTSLDGILYWMPMIYPPEEE